MLSRSLLALGACLLAALAALVSSQDGDSDMVPFFVGLTLVGGIGAWAVQEPYSGTRKLVGRVIAVAWVVTAISVGGLLLWYQALCACSGPVPPPEATYIGLTATFYRLAALFVGGALIGVAAFSRALAAEASSGGRRRSRAAVLAQVEEEVGRDLQAHQQRQRRDRRPEPGDHEGAAQDGDVEDDDAPVDAHHLLLR